MEFDDLKELVDAFLDETRDVLVDIEQQLIDLEQAARSGAVSFGRLEPLLRPLHTFKGNAGMLGMETIASLVHAIEELIKKDVPADPGFVGTLFTMVDDLKAGLVRIGEGQEDAPELRNWIAHLDGAIDDNASAVKPVNLDDSSELPAFGLAPDPEPEPAMDAPADHGITVEGTLKVSSDRLDLLQREVGELILAFNAVNDHLQGSLKPFLNRNMLRESGDLMDKLSRRVRTVQSETTQIRLLGLSAILQRVPRIVRDAAEKTGKKVQIVIDGEQTEADKSVVGALADVIVHLVRNAVDHGLESPDVRRFEVRDLLERPEHRLLNEIVGVERRPSPARQPAGRPALQRDQTAPVELIQRRVVPPLRTLNQLERRADARRMGIVCRHRSGPPLGGELAYLPIIRVSTGPPAPGSYAPSPGRTRR